MATDSSDTSRVLVTPDDLLGFEIDGRYRLDSILGGGGMGVVYRTTQQNLNREIAIKLLKLEDAADSHRVDRFQREIDIIARLSHPNIVRVFDSGKEPRLGLHYIAMELVEGVPLDEVMRDHRMAPELAIDLAYEVCAALTEPHRMEIIHRDIKPANVLVTSRSDDTVGVKVVDFGIARGVSSEHASKITTTGVVVGSPMYMAPEVARGESLDGRTDLYSVGVLLFEMITGATPFRGSTPVAIMLKQAVDDPPSLRDSAGPDFAVPELIDLVDELLSKDRRRRPADARTVLRRLDEIRSVHGMKRARIDGTKPPLEALASYLYPEVREEVGEERVSDPYSPTTPYRGGSAVRPESGSFRGWLVPEAARNSLDGSRPPATPLDTAQIDDGDSISMQSYGWAKGIVALAVIAVVTAGIWAALKSDPDNAEEPLTEMETVQIGDGAVPAPEPSHSQAAVTVEEVPAEVRDAGASKGDPSVTAEGEDDSLADVAAKNVRGPEKGAGVREPPAVVPTSAEQPDEVGGNEETPEHDELEEGMKWLHEK